MNSVRRSRLRMKMKKATRNAFLVRKGIAQCFLKFLIVVKRIWITSKVIESIRKIKELNKNGSLGPLAWPGYLESIYVPLSSSP